MRMGSKQTISQFLTSASRSILILTILNSIQSKSKHKHIKNSPTELSLSPFSTMMKFYYTILLALLVATNFVSASTTGDANMVQDELSKNESYSIWGWVSGLEF